MTTAPDELDDDVLDEEAESRSQYWQSIAIGLAALSDAPDYPKDVSPAPRMFTDGDVDFADDSWVSRLMDVKDWLRFEDGLPTKSREAFLKGLAGALEMEPSEALEGSGDGTSLTAEGLERLNQRVETAVGLMQAFIQDLEDEGANRNTATQRWINSWSEAEAYNEPITPEPVTATADVLPIFELAEGLNLTPSYQRGDVWTTGDRQQLIESIVRGIPLPSIILLEKDPDEPIEVVDGKQRLTSILRFIGKHPIALEKVEEVDKRHPGHNLKQLFHDDYPKFRLAWKRLEASPLTAAKEDEFYFPFKLRRGKVSGLKGPELELLQGRYYSQMRSNKINIAAQRRSISQLFEKTTAYKVPVIKYTRATQRQIHEVFRLYNKQGVHLNAEELRNAVYHDVELTRATLVAAGDADRHAQVDIIAESLAGIPHLDELGRTLAAYGFGIARYKRSKILSWVISVLLHQGDDKKGLASTAKHIDHLLDEIKADQDHPLRHKEVLARLFTWIAESVELHAGHDELWPDAFKDGDKGAKWQELQLVGSLVGIALANAAAPDVEDRIEVHADEIRQTALTHWKRPANAQTKSQWEYIARIATGILDLLEVDRNDASSRVRALYGSSGLESLQRMLFDAESDQ